MLFWKVGTQPRTMQAQGGQAITLQDRMSSELSLSPNGGIAAAVPRSAPAGHPGQHPSSASISSDAQPTFLVPVGLCSNPTIAVDRRDRLKKSLCVAASRISPRSGTSGKGYFKYKLYDFIHCRIQGGLCQCITANIK